MLTELEYLGHQRRLPRVVCSAKLERARMLMLQGNAQAASEELDRTDGPEVWSRVQRQRLPAHETDDMAVGRQPCFTQPIAQDEAGGRQRRVLQVLARQRCDEPAAAARSLGVLLQRYQDQRADRGGARDDPLFDDDLQCLLDAAGPAAVLAEGSAPATALQEPLTRKEIRVLQLLSAAYSNSALAGKLFVSDSTVRTHLRNINLKLGAKSRTQAVAIARRPAVIR